MHIVIRFLPRHTYCILKKNEALVFELLKLILQKIGTHLNTKYSHLLSEKVEKSFSREGLTNLIPT